MNGDSLFHCFALFSVTLKRAELLKKPSPPLGVDSGPWTKDQELGTKNWTADLEHVGTVADFKGQAGVLLTERCGAKGH
jgi:hypothetical protein